MADVEMTTYQAPRLPTLAALRDRSEERRVRAAHAHQDGFEVGLAEGLAAGRDEVAAALAAHRAASADLRRATEALEVATADLRRRDAVAINGIEDELFELATELAIVLVGRSLALTDDPVVDAVRRGLALAQDRDVPVVRVHPAGVDAITEALANDATAPATAGAAVEVVSDPSIERGGCVVDVGDGRIDAQIGTAIERLRALATRAV